VSGNLLAPDTVTIERKNPIGVSPTGEQTFSPSGPIQVAVGVGCLIDALPVGSRMGGDLQVEVEGVVYVQTHVGFFGGLTPAQIAGAAPGSIVTWLGIPYLVSQNGRGAFIDIKEGDRITDQELRRYLVLARATYYEVMPTRQVRLQFGRSW